MVDDQPGNAGPARALQAVGIRPVRDDDGDLGWKVRRRAGVEQRLQIAAAPRNQHADAFARTHAASLSEPVKVTRCPLPVSGTISPITRAASPSAAKARHKSSAL